MNTSSSDTLTIRDYPLALWLVGIGVAASGVWGSLLKDGLVPGILIALGGALMVLLPTILTVTADRQRAILTVRHRSLIRSSVKEYPFRDITGVEVDRQMSQSSASYRMVLVLASGARAPLRSYYSGGYRNKENKARQLREFLGVARLEGRPATAAQAMRQILNPIFQPSSEDTTEGITWRLETANSGAGQLSRWMTSAFTLPGQFLCLMQKPKGSKGLPGGGGGLGGAFSHMLYQQVLTMYGFEPEDFPGLDAARAVESLDPRLESDFASITSDQAGAQQLLNPWAVMPLAQWVERYPLKTIQVAGQGGQLVVLFSPRGTFLTCVNAGPEQVEALTRLGVDLVRAQGAV